MDESLDTLFEFDKGAEVSDADDLYRYFGILLILLGGILPGIVKLLVAQADALALGVSLNDRNFDLLSLLEDFFRVLDACPAEVSDVDESLYAGLYFYKCAEFCQVGDGTLGNLAGSPALGRRRPGIVKRLADLEGDSVVLLVDAYDLYLDVVALSDDLFGLRAALP